MSLLRRVFGGRQRGGAPAPIDLDVAEADDAERDRLLLEEDGARLSGDLLARQLRYADRSWTPPAQGGPRRADDGAERGADLK